MEGMLGRFEISTRLVEEKESPNLFVSSVWTFSLSPMFSPSSGCFCLVFCYHSSGLGEMRVEMAACWGDSSVNLLLSDPLKKLIV